MSDTQNNLSKKEVLSELRKSPERKLILTVDEAAALTGYSPSFISTQVKNGLIAPFRPIGREEVKISRKSLDEWIEQHTIRTE